VSRVTTNPEARSREPNTMDDVRTQSDVFEEAPETAGVMFTRIWLSDDACVLEIRGDLDIAVSGLLHQELDELLDLGLRRLDVDLAGVLFMDSSALSALVQANDAAGRRDQQFTLRNPSPACMKVLTITGLDHVFGLS
jgi:anti-sigma B factor antagonist